MNCHSIQLLSFHELELPWSVLIELERDWGKLRLSESVRDRNRTVGKYLFDLVLTAQSGLVQINLTDSHNCRIILVVLYERNVYGIIYAFIWVIESYTKYEYFLENVSNFTKYFGIYSLQQPELSMGHGNHIHRVSRVTLHHMFYGTHCLTLWEPDGTGSTWGIVW